MKKLLLPVTAILILAVSGSALAGAGCYGSKASQQNTETSKPVPQDKTTS